MTPLRLDLHLSDLALFFTKDTFMDALKAPTVYENFKKVLAKSEFVYYNEFS